MTFASLAEIKKELLNADPDSLQTLCLRLAKLNAENKELLSYLLFDSQNEASYVQQIKEQMDVQFDDLYGYTFYIVKKKLRKILSDANRFIKYSNRRETEVEVRIYFCQKMSGTRVPLNRFLSFQNLYEGQLKKINAAVAKLPEDLQSDYASAIAAIENNTGY